MRRPHRRAHRFLAVLMALALPLILLSALMLRQDPSQAPAPAQLEPAE